MSRLAGFKNQNIPRGGTDKTDITPLPTLDNFPNCQLTELTKLTKGGCVSYVSSTPGDIPEFCSGLPSPVWIVGFGSGKRYRLGFAPLITQHELAATWDAKCPDQPATFTHPLPAKLWGAMAIAAKRNGWNEATWQIQIELLIEAVSSGRCTVDELTDAYIAVPGGFEEQRKADMLATMGITRYESKPAPTFTLISQPVPTGPAMAVELIGRY